MKLRAKKSTCIHWGDNLRGELRFSQGEIIALNLNSFEVVDEPEKVQEIEVPKFIVTHVSNNKGHSVYMTDEFMEWMESITATVNQLLREGER